MPTRHKTWVSAFGFIILMFTAVVWAAPVPDTGQTKCYDATVEITCPSPGQPFYGQNGNYTINPMSYNKLDDSGNALSDSAASWVMVRDNVTGLIWEMKTDDGTIHDKYNRYTWYDPTDPAPGIPGDGTDTKDFIDALNSVYFGSYNDWRLPTIKELDSIVVYDIPDPGPTINTTYFPTTPTGFYWTSSTYARSPSYAWCMASFATGDITGGKWGTLSVRAVRGGPSLPAYVDNGNGTVSDTSSGLMWQQDTPDSAMTWEQALSHCENSTLADYTDWRLPTEKELRSLVDYSRYNPAINSTFFSDTVSSTYWSSSTNTTSVSSTSSAQVVDFYGADTTSQFTSYNTRNKTNNNYVRAVRGGQPGSFPPSSARVDFNADGKPDILWRHISGANCVWYMIGAMVSGWEYLPTADPSWAIVGVGDFNADGKPDILWRHTSGVNYVWYMNGASVIGGDSILFVDPSWAIVNH